MIKLGSNNIGKIYLGSNSIGKAYLGSNIVFQKGSSPTPPGPTPSYEPVFYDYLVFDGTAYIDTDIVPPENASFRVRLGGESSGAQRCFVVGGSDGTYFGMNYYNISSSNRYWYIYYGSSEAVDTSHSLGISTTSYAFFLTPNNFGFGSNHTYSITKGSGVPTGGIVLGSTVGHSGNPYTGTMGIFRIYGSNAQNVTTNTGFDSYTPVYTLRPCTYGEEAGMWCVETSTFYGNTAGAGTLTVSNS